MTPTYTVLRAANDCPDVVNCEHVLRFADAPPNVTHLILKEETDPERLAAVAHLIGPGERLGYTTLLPEVW
jgi:hypothetical protein